MMNRIQTICVPWTVNVAIMSRICLILYVGRVDRNTTRFFLWSFVDFGVICEFCSSDVREDLGDGSRQRGLAVIDMSWKIYMKRSRFIQSMLAYQSCQCSYEALLVRTLPHQHRSCIELEQSCSY